LSLLLCQTDRKLALSVGKALNSQRFFHDVKYENFLLDDEDHIYQFYSSKEGVDEFKGNGGLNYKL
jgi:hypothetical protein